jgi:hypothetical protein
MISGTIKREIRSLKSKQLDRSKDAKGVHYGCCNRRIHDMEATK